MSQVPQFNQTKTKNIKIKQIKKTHTKLYTNIERKKAADAYNLFNIPQKEFDSSAR